MWDLDETRQHALSLVGKGKEKISMPCTRWHPQIEKWSNFCFLKFLRLDVYVFRFFFLVLVSNTRAYLEYDDFGEVSVLHCKRVCFHFPNLFQKSLFIEKKMYSLPYHEVIEIFDNWYVIMICIGDSKINYINLVKTLCG